MNILITGVAGLIGSNLADWLINNKRADNVVGVDDLSGGYIDNVNEGVIFHKENLIEDNLNYIFERGGTKDVSIDEAADTLIEVMGGGSKVTLTARHEVKHAWSTWNKSIKLLGYKENHTLKQGLSIMWEWAKKQPKRAQQIWESYELDKGMYDFWK